jgi:hypothetical protein
MTVYPPAAELFYAQQAKLAAAAQVAALKSWRRVDSREISGSWAGLVRPLVSIVSLAQITAASGVDRFTDSALGQLGVSGDSEGDVSAAAFGGWAGDGRSLSSLLDVPPIAAKQLIAQGRPVDDALRSAGSLLQLMAATAVQDAGRAAISAAIGARPKVAGYVRMLNVPSCSRCALLAGKFFKWNAGFKRHPRCDCVHIPASEDVAGDMLTDSAAAIASGKVTGITSAQARAIAEGADIGQVLNATRGMSVAQVFGRRLQITTEGATRRGYAGQLLGARARGTALRLTPESIFRIAGDDRAEAVRLLKRFGYIL